MAEALEALYPGVKLAIGPAVENGFYYDVDLGEGRSISSEDFPEIEKKMLELAKAKSRFVRQEISKADAIAYFQEKQDPYKLELLENLEDGQIPFTPKAVSPTSAAARTFPTPAPSKRPSL
jgi:threonyl-tRNA synthetase